MSCRRARRSAALPAPRSDPRGHTTATTPIATACAGTTAATGIAVGAEPSGRRPPAVASTAMRRAGVRRTFQAEPEPRNLPAQSGKSTGRGVMPAQPKGPGVGRWYILALISLMYLITYLDRVNISTVAPVISKEFNFDKATMGIIFSAFIWSYALFQVPGGWLGDRIGPRKVLSTIMAYRTVIAVITTFSIGFKSFWGIRFALGVGEAGAFPTATRAMQMWYPRDERGFVQGISHAASRFGAAIGPPVAVAIMIHFGWRSVFYVIGILSLLWSLLYMLVYRNMPEE